MIGNPTKAWLTLDPHLNKPQLPCKASSPQPCSLRETEIKKETRQQKQRGIENSFLLEQKAVRALCGEFEVVNEHNLGMIYPAIGIGQVATATLAPDPQDRLELAQNESRRARERQTGGEGKGGGKMALVGWIAARGFDNSAVMNRRDGASHWKSPEV